MATSSLVHRLALPPVVRRAITTIGIVLLSSCGGGGGSGNTSSTGIPPSATETATALQAPFGAASISAAATALTQSGLTVVNDDGSAVVNDDGSAAVGLAMKGVEASAPLGLQLMRFQARTLALEVKRGGGILGADLDAVTPPIPLPPDGTGIEKQVTISLLLASYVKTTDSYGARVARGLMGEIDLARHNEYRYPTLVLYSFMQEAMIPLLAEMEAADPPATRLGAIRYAQLTRAAAIGLSDPCGSINRFLDDLAPTVTRAVSSLSPQTSGIWSGIFAVAAVVAGVAVDAAVGVAKAVVRHTPAVSAVRNAMKVAHAVAGIKAMFSHWDAKVAAAPGGLHKTPGLPNAGAFTVTVSTGSEGDSPPPAWPPAVKSCAALLDIPLPDPNSADGATVTWEKIAGFDTLAIVASPLTTTIASNQATLNFTTAAEPESDHDNPGSILTPGKVTVRANVSVPGVENLIAGVAPSLNGIAQVAAPGATSAAAQVFAIQKDGEATVEYHQPGSATIHITDGAVFHAVSCAGILGPYAGTLSADGGSGAVAFSFDPSTKVAPVSTSFPIPGAIYAMNATFTLGGSDAAPTVAVIAGIIVTTPMGASAGTFGGTYPVTVGPSPECAAQ